MDMDKLQDYYGQQCVSRADILCIPPFIRDRMQGLVSFAYYDICKQPILTSKDYSFAYRGRASHVDCRKHTMNADSMCYLFQQETGVLNRFSRYRQVVSELSETIPLFKFLRYVNIFLSSHWTLVSRRTYKCNDSAAPCLNKMTISLPDKYFVKAHKRHPSDWLCSRHPCILASTDE